MTSEVYHCFENLRNLFEIQEASHGAVVATYDGFLAKSYCALAKDVPEDASRPQKILTLAGIMHDFLNQTRCSLLASNWVEQCTDMFSSKYALTITTQTLNSDAYYLVFGRPKLIMRLSPTIIGEVLDGVLARELQDSEQRFNLYETIYWKNARSFEELLKRAETFDSSDSSTRDRYRKLLVVHRNRCLSRNTAFLTFNYMDHDFLHQVALKPFYACDSKIILFYMSQFFQSLRFAKKQLTAFLVSKSQDLPSIANNLIWFCRVEKVIDDSQRKVPLPIPETLDEQSEELEALVMNRMDRREAVQFDR